MNAESSILAALFDGHPLLRPDRSWPDQVQVAHGDPGRLPELLRHPLLLDFQDLADHYRGPLSFGRGLHDVRTFDSQANAASLLRLGLTVYLRDLGQSLPGTADFLRGLERELGVAIGSARLTGFASPCSDGVPLHFDAEEVISIQLQGCKRFSVGVPRQPFLPYGSQYGPGMVAVESLYEQSREGFPDPADADFRDIDMQPGSVLYLPRGTWHHSVAEQDSFSISIVIRPPVLLEALLQHLQPLLLGDTRWRRPLYRADADQERELRPLLEQLAQMLIGLPARRLLSTTEDEGPYLKVPTSHAEVRRLSDERSLLRVRALDGDWRPRLSLDTELPTALLPVIEHVVRQFRAFELAELAADFPLVPLRDLHQLMGLLRRGHLVRQLIPRP